MVDRQKVINFLQDFGCAKLSHLQKLFGDENDNFKNILYSNMVSKKGDIFVHNTQKINDNMLVALDILCKYKKRFIRFYQGYKPVYITLLTNEHLLYHIIVANEDNKKGIVKLINSYPLSLPKADKLILAFPSREELENIDCQIPFLYTTYPEFVVLNNEEDEEENEEIT
ncbi:MAG: hypothetical protein HFJ35_03025 [Clostridia bacterium]|nr:hypothetical protein [Clostridia bacterium]